MGVPDYKLIKVAREFRLLTQKELSWKLENINQPNLSKLEKGYIKFSDEHSKQIASKLNLPMSFFEQSQFQMPVTSLIFKNLSKLSKKEIEKINVDTGLIAHGIDTLLSFFNSREDHSFINLNLSTMDLVDTIKYRLKIPNVPGLKFEQYIEESNIVVHYYHTTKYLDGISTFTTKGKPVIMINKLLPYLKKKEIFCRELGYLCLLKRNKDYQNTDIATINNEITDFVGEFLIPKEICSKDLNSLTLKKIDILSKQWLVSKQLILERAKQLEALQNSTYNYLKIELVRRRKQDTNEIDLEALTNLNKSLYLIKRELNYTNKDFAEMINLPYDDFAKLFLLEK